MPLFAAPQSFTHHSTVKKHLKIATWNVVGLNVQAKLIFWFVTCRVTPSTYVVLQKPVGLDKVFVRSVIGVSLFQGVMLVLKGRELALL